MIVANGVDIVKISRIEKLFVQRKDKFLNKVFTDKEMDYINSRNNNSQTISGIFAAKEAISKVLGTGIGKVNWKDIEISHNEKGMPIVNLYGGGLEIANHLRIGRINLSISHEKDYAIAFAIGETIENKENIIVPEELRKILSKRDKNSHKGSFGRIGIISGSTGMTGSTYLSTMAALRSGGGLVYTITPRNIYEVLSIKLIEAIIKPVEDNNKGHFTKGSTGEILDIIKDMDVLGIGPGIGVDKERIELIKKILLNYKNPIVLDADGINCIAKIEPNILKDRKGDTVITPHLGELSRLLNVEIKEIWKNPVEYSKYTSNKYRVITVLKGADTVVSNKEGEIYINSTGNPGMATAGSGDVLTGVISSFIGQGIESFNAAKLGVYCHGLAGDLAKADKGEYGMIARDILEHIPYSIKKLQ